MRWFGDNTVSVVDRSELRLLEEGLDKMTKTKGGKLAKKLDAAILEAQEAERQLQEKVGERLTPPPPPPHTHTQGCKCAHKCSVVLISFNFIIILQKAMDFNSKPGNPE